MSYYKPSHELYLHLLCHDCGFIRWHWVDGESSCLYSVIRCLDCQKEERYFLTAFAELVLDNWSKGALIWKVDNEAYWWQRDEYGQLIQYVKNPVLHTGGAIQ